MPMSKAEAGRLGGRASARNMSAEQRAERARVAGRAAGGKRMATMTPAERKELSRRGYLVGAVNTIASRAGELDEDQRRRLLEALEAGGGPADG